MSERAKMGQALVNMKTGDKIILDTPDADSFVRLATVMGESASWFLWEDRILLNKGDISSVYFLPNGYEASCGGLTKAGAGA